MNNPDEHLPYGKFDPAPWGTDWETLGFMLAALVVQIVLAAIIQHYSQGWFFLFCFASLLINLYYLYHFLIITLCVLNDEMTLRFLASEMKTGITEEDLKAAYARR